MRTVEKLNALAHLIATNMALFFREFWSGYMSAPPGC
jgi:hypothetical protein